jgi:hypothetical protein
MKYAERLAIAATTTVETISNERAIADLELRKAQIKIDVINLKAKLDKLKSAKALDFIVIYETDSQIALKEREMVFLETLAKELF